MRILGWVLCAPLQDRMEHILHADRESAERELAAKADEELIVAQLLSNLRLYQISGATKRSPIKMGPRLVVGTRTLAGRAFRHGAQRRLIV